MTALPPSTFDLLPDQKKAATFPEWIYDGSDIPDPFGHGERAVRFLRSLRHPKSILPGRAFSLDPWQERIVRRVYGPRHENGTRIVNTVALLLPRGNRKTSLAAALALLHTIGPERRPGGEAIFAAADRKQAGIGFREAAGIIREDKRLVSGRPKRGIDGGEEACRKGRPAIHRQPGLPGHRSDRYRCPCLGAPQLR